MPSVAADRFLAACVQPEGMVDALATLVEASGGAGATLVRSRGPMPLAVVSTRAIAAPVSAYITGDTPRDPRTDRVYPRLDEGFRIDQDDFSLREIARDPFYQEFLRPHGVGWNACALLGHVGNGDEIHISIKREYDRGPFGTADIAPVNAVLPALRAAIGFARLVRDLPATDDVRSGPRRFVLGLDRHGRAVELASCPGRDRLLQIVDGQIRMLQPRNGVVIDELVSRGLRGQSVRSALVEDVEGARWVARLRSLDPSLVELGGPLGAILVLTKMDAEIDLDTAVTELQDIFGLSRGEARVARLLAMGRAGRDIARALDLSQGTVRNHLKVIFAKTGAANQIELAVLLARIVG
jgi:DNA-binding CsgD family transcriptional regulator